MNNFGKRIKEIRKKHGLTQQQFADSLGYAHKSTINKIESGQENMSYQKILILLKEYMLSAEELFDDANEEIVCINKKNSEVKYQDINSKAIDEWIDEGWRWGKPINHDVYTNALNGKYEILLTPTKPMPHNWIGEIKGKNILGLASGGGQQMPIFAALGANCTVLDYSKKQIESDLMVADREGYKINAIRADMSRKLPFDDESFDIIFHPVSNCYIENVIPLFKECYRILKKGGILVCGLDNGINYIVDESEKKIVNHMPFNPLKNKDQMRQLEEHDSGIQFSHTLEEQIGGQLKAGFILSDLYEDTNGEGYLHKMNIKSFVATRAIKSID